MWLEERLHTAILRKCYATGLAGVSFLEHASWRVDNYTVFQKKLSPLMFDNNFRKFGPIFNTVSPGDL